MSDKKPYRKLITVYDIRKTLYLHPEGDSATETLKKVMAFNEQSQPYMGEIASKYLWELEAITESMEIKTLRLLRPLSDTIYLEGYQHTLASSVHQFHYDSMAVIRRYAKLMDKDRTFRVLLGRGDIFSQFLSEVLVCSYEELLINLALLPDRETTFNTSCSCELMNRYILHFQHKEHIKVSEFIAFCDKEYKYHKNKG